jgi:hypothetical protein
MNEYTQKLIDKALENPPDGSIPIGRICISIPGPERRVLLGVPKRISAQMRTRVYWPANAAVDFVAAVLSAS